MDNAFTHIAYSYFNKEVIIETDKPTYTEDNKPILGKQYSWNHPLSDIVNALKIQGLQLDLFNEYDYSPYSCFDNSEEVEPGKWQIKGLEGKLPMVYSMRFKRLC
jgi:hypothetical protein